MKPPPFDYRSPASLDEALAFLEELGPEAKPLAGGQSLIPMLNFRLARPSVLVDLNGVAELDGIEACADGGLRMGAMTRQREVERSPLVAERAPLLAETMPHVAHPQIRNRGTLGGSVAHADPAAELPAVLLALGARFRVRRHGDGGEGREVEAGDFFTGLFTTALEAEELLTEVCVPPLPPGSGWAFEEVARRHGDYALAGVAAVVRLDDGGACREARLAYVNAGPVPLAAPAAAALLAGEEPGPEALRAAAEAAARELDPPADVHAASEYRKHLARVLTVRALERAFRRAAAPPASGEGGKRPVADGPRSGLGS